ncbi:MAG TPA: tRNA (adenosine(37)-N6)-threonylcarbamoyltransferase complex dimerization subunit type 1 TsaB [Pseudonocardiaceae bacterium]|nr:tRNA (adenosine(37)-N6)-threonylcarbamoyltransferase complex dimerization subunit type 1 TsaB [Pseudonocardiaceae bacterium]
MLVLALDTATSAVTAGLLRLPAAGSPVVQAERVSVNARAHGELLMPSVCEVLASAGVSMRDLDAVVCGVGPGPFTGLRVGMVTAAALGDALSIPVYPVCSLDAIAHRSGPGSPLLVITDARRREVYWACYDSSGARVDGPHVNRPEDLPLAGVSRVAGGATALELPAAPRCQSELRQSEPCHPDPAALVAVAAAALRAHAAPSPLTPLYLRRPDAVEPGPAKRVTPV